MEIEQLSEFYLLAETLNFSETADQLFIAQSTLSRHIKGLEKELGVPLFLRSKRKVELNDYGKLLMPYAKQIVRLQCEMTEAVKARQQVESRLLTVGTISAIPQYGISDILAAFSECHPEISLEITEGESDALENMVRNGTLDFAFVNSRGEPHRGLVERRLLTDSLTVMVSERHPLASLTQVSLDSLCDESFLMLPDNTFLMDVFVEICNQAGFTPHICFHSIRGDNIADVVSKNMGITITPRKAATYHPPEGVVLLDIVPEIEIYVNIVSKEDDGQSYIKSAFNEFLDGETLL